LILRQFSSPEEIVLLSLQSLPAKAADRSLLCFPGYVRLEKRNSNSHGARPVH